MMIMTNERTHMPAVTLADMKEEEMNTVGNPVAMSMAIADRNNMVGNNLEGNNTVDNNTVDSNMDSNMAVANIPSNATKISAMVVAEMNMAINTVTSTGSAVKSMDMVKADGSALDLAIEMITETSIVPVGIERLIFFLHSE